MLLAAKGETTLPNTMYCPVTMSICIIRHGLAYIVTEQVIISSDSVFHVRFAINVSVTILTMGEIYH